MGQLSTFVKSSVLDRKRLLEITNEYISFDDKDIVGTKATRLSMKDTLSFRHGSKPIQGYMFTIGRIYCIDIKDNDGQTIKIRLRSIYGIRSKQLFKKFAAILESLYNLYMADMIQSFVKKIEAGEDCLLAGVTVSKQGVTINSKTTVIEWEDVGLRKYYHKFSIHSKQHSENYYIAEYVVQWNSYVLRSVVEAILLAKGLLVQ